MKENHKSFETRVSFLNKELSNYKFILFEGDYKLIDKTKGIKEVFEIFKNISDGDYKIVNFKYFFEQTINRNKEKLIEINKISQDDEWAMSEFAYEQTYVPKIHSLVHQIRINMSEYTLNEVKHTKFNNVFNLTNAEKKLLKLMCLHNHSKFSEMDSKDVEGYIKKDIKFINNNYRISKIEDAYSFIEKVYRKIISE